jgi:hypothetical protein
MKHSNRYTREQFIEAVKNSESIHQTLKALRLKAQEGNYRVFRELLLKYNVDTTHFRGQLWNKGRKSGPRRPTEDYLNNTLPIQSHKLKQRLLKEKLLDRKCYKCSLTSWNNQPIPIELEHVDRNSMNNTLSNLIILCPNCHAQTSTYRRKNIGKRLSSVLPQNEF